MHLCSLLCVNFALTCLGCSKERFPVHQIESSRFSPGSDHAVACICDRETPGTCRLCFSGVATFGLCTFLIIWISHEQSKIGWVSDRMTCLVLSVFGGLYLQAALVHLLSRVSLVVWVEAWHQGLCIVCCKSHWIHRLAANRCPNLLAACTIWKELCSHIAQFTSTGYWI